MSGNNNETDFMAEGEADGPDCPCISTLGIML